MKQCIITILFCVLLGIGLNGCSTVGRVDELLTLKELAKEQSKIAKIVDEKDARFEDLLNDYKEGNLEGLSKRRTLRRKYGKPVLEKTAVLNGQPVDVWVYRRSTQFFGVDKIYFYFDEKGKLVDSKLVSLTKTQLSE